MSVSRVRLLGRDGELSRLSGFLDEAESNTPRSVVLRGLAGVGKTALLAAAVDGPAGRGFTILRAAGVESGSELAYWGLSELLVDLETAIDGLPSPQAAALRTAVSTEGKRVAVESFAVYAALRLLLATLADGSPVLIAVDDAQWLDGATLEALRFATRRMEDARVVVVLTVRDGEGLPVEFHQAVELSVGGLAELDSVALLRTCAPGITDGVAVTLHTGTTGNPLALGEIARHLDADQLAGCSALPDPLPVGRHLERGFARRAESLPEATRRALLIAAASETDAARLVLDGMASEGIDQTALGAAEAVSLVSLDRGRVRWQHPLVRSSVLSAARPDELRAAHRSLAAAARAPEEIDQRTWHLAAATETVDEGIAELLDELAGRASARGAPATNMRALEFAAQLSPAGGDAAQRFLSAAETAIAVGETAHALFLIEVARRRSEEPTVTARGELLRARAEILSGGAQVGHDRLVAAAGLIEDADPALATIMMSEATVAHLATGNRGQFRSSAERGIELGLRVGGGAEALPSIMLAFHMIAEGETVAAFAMLERYRSVAEDPALWAAAPEIVGMYALTHSWVGRHEDAQRLLAPVLAAARDAGAVRGLVFPLAARADVLYRIGQWPGAFAAAEESTRLAEATGVSALLANSLTYLARIEAGLGRVDAAREHGEQALELTSTLGLSAVSWYGFHALGLLELSLGRYEQAVRTLGRHPAWETWTMEPGLSLWAPDHIESLIRIGSYDDARAELDDLRNRSESTGRAHGHATVARYDGMLGGDDDLDCHFARAATYHSEAGMPFETARSQLIYGERLRRARRRVDARRQLADAYAIFGELGATIWAERARRELSAAGQRTSTPQPASPWTQLSAQETSVARVILTGATYNEAAAELFLSPRTIESHLRQIYRKLDIRSRSELNVALAAGTGLAT